MRNQKSWRRQEPLRKTMQCSCGASATLRIRKNFSFGRKSPARIAICYVCPSCKIQFAMPKRSTLSKFQKRR